jgi:hypothetical protein
MTIRKKSRTSKSNHGFVSHVSSTNNRSTNLFEGNCFVGGDSILRA